MVIKRIKFPASIPLSNDGIDPPIERLSVKYIDINGREEHEALLKDTEKCKELGLDVYYETIKYIKRWDGWLNKTCNYCINPKSILTQETCCAGCSKLKEKEP